MTHFGSWPWRPKIRHLYGSERIWIESTVICSFSLKLHWIATAFLPKELCCGSRSARIRAWLFDHRSATRGGGNYLPVPIVSLWLCFTSKIIEVSIFSWFRSDNFQLFQLEHIRLLLRILPTKKESTNLTKIYVTKLLRSMRIRICKTGGTCTRSSIRKGTLIKLEVTA
jgi:hypothetical protein